MPRTRTPRPKALPTRTVRAPLRGRPAPTRAPAAARPSAAERAAAAAPKTIPPQTPLNAAQKRYLRGFTHALKPVILVGQKGITPALLLELDGALRFHELVKVKLADDDREVRAESIEQMQESSKAEVVQAIGKVVCFYRCNPDHANFDLPR